MISLILKGMAIGVANIIPGVSGGTLAVVLGVYDKLTESIGNFFTSTKKEKLEYAKFLLQIGIGVILGIVLFAKLIEFSVANYPKITAGVFTLLIVPSIPFVVKKEDKKDIKNLFFLSLGIVFTLAFIYANYRFGADTRNIVGVGTLTLGYLLKLFFCGSLAAGAMIIPGISGSLLLLMLGEYYNILAFINDFFSNLFKIFEMSSFGEFMKNFHIAEICSFGMGMVVGLVLVAKIINVLLKKYRSATLFFITGIVIVSILQIWIEVI